METGTVILIIVGLYLLISLLTGIIPSLRITKSVSGYVAGDRSMNAFILYFVLGASIFSSFAFLGGPGWAYSRGAAAFYIIAYGVIGIVPLYFFGPRAWRLGKKYGYVTQAELLAARFDSKFLSVMLAILSVVVFIPYLTLQMVGAGYVLNVISEGMIPYWAGAGVTYVVVLIYVYFSGVMGVGWSNAFQGMFMMVLAWVLGIYLPNTLYGGIGPMFDAIMEAGHTAMLEAPGLAGDGTRWDWWGYGSAVFVSAVGFSVWPHFFMRSFAARNVKAMRLSVVLYPTFLIFLIPILLIGFSAVVAFPGVEPADSILPHILMQLDLPAIVIGLFCAGALAASMSSGDAILHSAASIGIRDGLSQVTDLNDKTERLLIQISVLVIGLIAYLFAVVIDVSIVALLLGSYGGVAQIFPVIFAMFYWSRATKAGALAGLFGGIAINTLFLIFPEIKPLPVHEGVYGLIANVVLLIGVSLATKPDEPERVRKFRDSG
ncbi:sodium:solute symporter family protein [Rhodohalobacter sp. SW132]|uniref:sodium:solute symporter family protein n=1 Tax=Rhodohalobacter sp. SW132 TaxID=2293433 RepID=UPI000E276D67|nr:sodium:solute symporter family protein [Rhodohalobacter sp. SW132]REL32859.1 sodium:solute symporter family protein [Rhodohalobacter sp. SW132]